MEDSSILPSQTLRKVEGYCDLKMWEAAWEELEALPPELKQDLTGLTRRMEIQMGMGEYQKASFTGLSLVQQFPKKLGVLLLTAECLIKCQDFQTASHLLRKGLSTLPDQADLWLKPRTSGGSSRSKGGSQELCAPVCDPDP